MGEAVLRDTVRTRTNAQSHKTPLRRASRRRSHSHDGRNNSAPAERVHPAFSAIAWQLEHSQTVLGAAELKDALRRLEPGLRGPRCLLGLLACGLEGPSDVSNAGGVGGSVCPFSTVRAILTRGCVFCVTAPRGKAVSSPSRCERRLFTPAAVKQVTPLAANAPVSSDGEAADGWASGAGP